MNITKNSQPLFLTTTNILEANKISSQENFNSFEVISPYLGDPFVGHLSTPITTSKLTKKFLNILPAYNSKLSPLLKGIYIGFSHGYFLLGPFADFGPLRHSSTANFIAFLSSISLIILLTACLLMYSCVTFNLSKQVIKNSTFLSSTNWATLTSGFFLGGFGGSGCAYFLLKFIYE